MKRWAADKAAGRLGEDLACRYLQDHGFTIVARNYRARSGVAEIDLVGWDGPVLAFIEVKSRATEEYGTPDRAVDREKQRHLMRAAREYTRRADIDWERVRFDIVSVVFEHPPRIVHFPDAFSARRSL